jgi:DNA-binding response OmpR family regulator
VSQALGESPFDVIYTRTPVECLASVETVRPVLVIVECDGASSLPVLLDRLRANSSAQVMLIGPDADQGLGALEMGIGVDYVKSPVRETELRARVRRHATRGVEQETLRFGELSIDPVARSVRLAGKLVHLKALEFDLLKFLASRAGSLFTRRELLEHVWGSSEGWQQLDTVTEHVYRVRRKLESIPSVQRRIVTVPGAGYYFEGGATTAAFSGDRSTSG